MVNEMGFITFFILLCITSDGASSSQRLLTSQKKHLETPGGLWAANDVRVNFAGIAPLVHMQLLSLAARSHCSRDEDTSKSHLSSHLACMY